MENSKKKWADVILTGENEPVLEGSLWKSVQAEEVAGMISKNEFQEGGKLIRTQYFKQKYGDFRDEVNTYIDTWGRDGDNIKMVYGGGASLFEGKYHSNLKKIIGAINFSDGRIDEESFVPFIENNEVKEIQKNNSITNNQDYINNKPNINYSPIVDDSKPGPFLFLGISSVIICLFLFIKTVNSAGDIINLSAGNMLSSIITPIIVLVIGFIFFGKYSKEKNKRQYYEICKSMEYWLGHSSDELVVSWGTPSKTSKLPNDKSITIMEYRDSITNYSGVSTRTSYGRGFSTGYHFGQSKATKYIKTFYVQNGFVIDYKYSIH